MGRKQMKRDWGFKGIKYSDTTKIFYSFEKGDLYKFKVYPGSSNGWEKSDYFGYENNHKKWIDATPQQIKDWDLESTFRKTIKRML